MKKHCLLDGIVSADLQQTQTGSAFVVELLYSTGGIESVFVAHGIRISVMRAAHVEMLGEDNALDSVHLRREQSALQASLRFRGEWFTHAD